MSKYKAKKVTVDAYTFDSKTESKYYEKLKEDKAKGLIDNFELQPRFILIPSFEKMGKKYRRLEYVGDFLIYHLDNTLEVIDIKGYPTEGAKLKRKLFNYFQPHKLTWLKWYKGEWVEC
jgi:hypothetical protein